MRKLKYLLLSFIILILSACTGSDDDKLKVVTTVFVEYDWTKNIVDGVENCEVSLICDTKTDLHSFTPSVSDLVTISNADVFIYIGGESDSWVGDALKNKRNEDMIVVNLMEELQDMLLEGEHDHEHEHEHEEMTDEHIWLSLDLAIHSVEAITDALVKADEVNESTYTNNSREYIERLEELDMRYKGLFESTSNKVICVADRFPFLYLCHDYNIEHYAAFNGCQAESEASFEVIAMLTDKIKEYGLKTVFTLENNNNKIANTLIKNVGDNSIEIMVLNSIQSVTLSEYNSGVRYISLMEENLKTLLGSFGEV